jgi:hypothetical protein
MARFTAHTADPKASGVRALGRMGETMGATGLQRAEGERCESPRADGRDHGRYWARTSDLQLVELALSQLS